MPMAFAPKSPRIRERTIFYGAGNAGKSTAALTIARRFTTGHIHIADADDAWEFMLYDDEEPNKALLARDNFTIHHIDNEKWDDKRGHLKVITDIEKVIEPGDLFIYDKISGGWGAAQDWYDHNVFGEGHAEYMLTMRKALETERLKERGQGKKETRTKPIYDDFRDWGPINAQYRLLYASLYRIATEAHVFICADAAVCRENDDGDMKKACQPFNNQKPAGQKALFGFPNTVIHFSHDVRAGEHKLGQVKDRSTRLARGTDQEPLYDEEWSDFTKTYLGPIAGWKMQKID